MKKKIKNLCKKLNFHDAAILEQSLMDVNRTIKWTPEQRKQINRIKNKIARKETMC